MGSDFKDWTRLTFNFDSHVETVCGNQQRAKAGYNSRKPGRKSFHPLLCFIGETRDFLRGRFLPGNRHSAQEAVGFLRECLKRLPGRVKETFLQADFGFFDNKFLSEAEERGVKYAIAAQN